MKKLLLCMLMGTFLLLQGCANGMFVMPVQENKDTLVRFNQPVAYEYELYPLTIENVNSRGEAEMFTYKEPPKRVVAVWQNSIETLMALGVGDRLVAANGVLNKKFLRPEYQEQYSQIPYTGLQLLDLETTMMLEPDLVIGWFSTFGKNVLRSTDFWKNRGVNTYIANNSVYSMPIRTLENEYDDIYKLGKIFDKNERAEEIVTQMKDAIAKAQVVAKQQPKKPKALVMEYMGGKNVRLYNEKTLAGNIVQQMNGELLAAKEVSIGLEQIVDMDPDAIFVVIMESHYGHEESVLQVIRDNKALSHLRCVRDGRLYAVPLNDVYASGVRTYDGIKIISEGLYPELKEK